MAGLSGLKGLTDQDREAWKQRYAADIAHLTEDEANRAYVHAKFKQKYGASPDFAELDKMNAAGKEEYWNNDYDRTMNKMDDGRQQLASDTLEQHRLNKIAAPSSDVFQSKDAYLENQMAYVEDSINNDEITDIRQLPSENEGIANANEQIVKDLQKDPRYYDWASNKEAYNEMMEEAKKRSEAYNREAAKLGSGNSKAVQNVYNNIKDIAEAVSPYYRKYKDKPEYLNFSPVKWREISTEFEIRRKSLGEDAALEYLQAEIQNEVERNTSWWEALDHGIRGMGASAVGSTIAFAGIAKGIVDYASGEHEDIEGASEFTNFIDAIVDNSWTRYGSDIMNYGTMFPEQIARAKEIGLSELDIVDTYENTKDDAGFWDVVIGKNTIPRLIAQYGFTAASLGEGAILNKASKGLFRVAKGRTLRNLMSQNARNITRAKQALGRIQKVEGFTNKALIPGIVGEGEAVIEALDTKQSFLEDGQRLIAEKQQEFVDQRFKELLAQNYDRLYEEAVKPKTFVLDDKENFRGHNEGGGMTPEEANQYVLNMLYEQAWSEYGDAYQASVDDLNYNAARAARTTFMLNSGINGLLNTTARSAWFDSNIQGRLKSSRLFGKASTGPKVDVSAAGKASVKYPWYKKAWNYAKEPIGEGTEEVTQSLAQAYSKGKSMNNLENFVMHKYKNDADVTVGDILWEDYAAGAAAVGDAFMDRDTWVSGFYGLASSVFGGVNLPGRARRADGSKGGVFERGVNAAGNRESTFEMLARIAPWRNSIMEAHRNIQAETKEAQDMADALQAWLDNPENRAKFDGLTGTLNWARDMQRSAEEGDEFGFRNSSMGKSINDALMLQKLRDTEYYNAYMREINEVAQLEEGSRVTDSYVQQARNNIAEFANKSDEEILEQLKSNANKVLENVDKIQKIGDKLDNTVGNLDIDTKEALIYGEMMMDDWKSRSETLEKELGDIKENSFVREGAASNSSANDKTRRAVATYGSVEAAVKAKEEFKKSIDEAQKKIDKTSAKTAAERQAVQAAKKALKEAKNKYKLLDKYEDMDTENTVLSEEDIMNLDPVSRATILNPKNRSKYSAKQQAIIDNLVNKATSVDPKFLDKALDAGHIRQAMQSYAADYAKTISDPEAFSVFSKNAKMAAVKEGYAKRYNAINNSKSYEEFADKMDKLIVNSTPYEQDTILKKFARENKTTPNEYYQRYMASREKAADVIKEASKGQVLSKADGNTIDLFTYATTYLTQRGVDITNPDAVASALSEQNEQGNLFQQYVAAMNEDADDATRVNFTDIGSIIQTYKDVISEFNKNTADRKVNSIPAKPVDKASSSPAVDTAGKAAKTQETLAKAASSNEPAVTSTTTAVNGTGDATHADPAPVARPTSEVAKLFEQEGNPQEVVEYVQMIEDNIDKGKYSDEQKAELRDILKSLNTGFYDNVASLYLACESKKSSIDIEGKDETAKCLQDCYRTALASFRRKKAKELRAKELQERSSVRVLDKSAVATKFVGASSYDDSIKNSNNMSTVSIDFLRSKYTSDPAKATAERPYSPTLEYLETHHVEQFLGANEIEVHKTPVYFMFDPELAAKQKKVWEEGKFSYDSGNMALVAVVENDKGPVVIDGKRYQPIGIMPSNGVGQSGSNRIAVVRQFINIDATSPYLVADNQGVIQSTLSEPVSRKKPQKYDADLSVVNTSMQSVLSPEDVDALEKMPAAERLKDGRYQKARRDFLSRVHIKDGGNYKQLAVDVPGRTGGTETDEVVFAVSEVRDTKTRDGKSVVELLRQNDTSVLHGNSRIRRWASTLEKLINGFDMSKIILDPNGEPTVDSDNLLKGLAETLNKELRNFLYPNGWSYKLEIGDNKELILSMVNNDTEKTERLLVLPKTLDDVAKTTILKNMVLDEGGEVRMLDSKRGVVKWQVTYADFAKKDDKHAQDNAADIYDDNILNASQTRMYYAVDQVSIAAPFDLQGKRQPYSYPKNTDNATTDDQGSVKTSDSQVIANGVTIDGETGTSIKGTNNAPKNREVAAAENAGKRLQAVSSSFHSTSTGHVGNGVSYEMRSVLGEDETLKAIGSEVKSIFDAVLCEKETELPKNMTYKAYTKFKDSVNSFRNSLVAGGITLLPKSIAVIWKSSNPNGDKLSDNMYFGYDAQGRWHVFYPVVSTSDLSKEDKENLSEYIAMMSQTMANACEITKSSVQVVPIKVDTPRSTHSIVDGQVMKNAGSAFNGAQPRLLETYERPASEITSYAQVQKKMDIDKAARESAKAVAEEGVSESALIEDETPLFDDGNTFEDMFGTPTKTSTSSKQGKMPATYVEKSQQWGKFEGRGLNAEATTRALETQGITEDAWNSMTSEEREHALECSGVK